MTDINYFQLKSAIIKYETPFLQKAKETNS